MPDNRRDTKPDFDFSADARLPRHVIVLLAIFLLLLVAGGGGLVYLFITTHTHPPTTVLAQASPTATVSATQNPYPPHTGRLALNDPLSDNSGGYRWDTGTVMKGASCTFTVGSYHVTVQAGFVACNAEAMTFGELAYQVQMTVLKGDRGGIFFRQVGSQGPYYYFSITITGSYELDASTGGKNLTILRKGTSPAIKTGLNQPNLLAVVAQGSMIDLYVNGQHIDQISDTTSSSGLIGVAAHTSHQPAEVAFSNAQVWTL